MITAATAREKTDQAPQYGFNKILDMLNDDIFERANNGQSSIGYTDLDSDPRIIPYLEAIGYKVTLGTFDRPELGKNGLVGHIISW